MFSVALEAVVPQCAIVRLNEHHVESNHESLSSLWAGIMYGSKERCNLITGSRAEGLAVQWPISWGHPESDADIMELIGGHLGVHVPQGRHPPGCAVLRYRPEGCPPAYCKIEVTDIGRLMEIEINKVTFQPLDARCVHRSEGVDWLHTQNLHRRLRDHHDISGPAGMSRTMLGFTDRVPALVCSDAHPDIDQNYLHRPRHGWPSSQQLAVIKQLPMIHVLTGHKLSPPDEIPFQARFSWSPAEMVLIMDLPLNIKQVYIAVKYTFKHFMEKFRGSEGPVHGRSTIGSYYLKTVFLRLLEKTPPTTIRSQLDLMLSLLYDLYGYIAGGKLPHYFLPDCDLLETVEPEERRIALDVIHHILSDPLRAILTCPTHPRCIYGKVQPGTLVDAFHQVSSHPTSARTRGHLLMLLGHLDETRQKRYHEQQECDERPWRRVSGRPQLMGLVEMLREQMKKY